MTKLKRTLGPFDTFAPFHQRDCPGTLPATDLPTKAAGGATEYRRPTLWNTANHSADQHGQDAV